MHTAVLLLVFNRPDTTRIVLEALRQVHPSRLYVAADGPRPHQAREASLCTEVRKIATSIDWPCQMQTLFRDTNLGCRRAVSSALDWFFDHEEEGIILEDDCVPHASFFSFCSELLDYYRDDKRVMCISGQHFPQRAQPLEASYFFSRYNHCWGWASWRRSWRLYDRDMSMWPQLRDTDFLLSLGCGKKLFANYWKDIFDRMHDGQIDSWDYPWTFSCWVQNGLTILPGANLVRNIGFGRDASHTRSGNPLITDLPLQRMEFPLCHPDAMVRDVWADRWEDRHIFKITPLNELRRVIIRGRHSKLISHIADLIRPR